MGLDTMAVRFHQEIIYIYLICRVIDIFHRLLPIAAASHVRLVTLNRRGYSGSTPLTEKETEPDSRLVTSGEDVTPSTTTRSNRVISDHYTTFLQQRSAELARFLAWYIDQEQIPLRSGNAGRASGGISLLGWSLGSVPTLSMLAFANTLDPGLVKKLEPYLRKVVVFGERMSLKYGGYETNSHSLDPSHQTLGYPSPANYHHPLFDPNIPSEERQVKLATWSSSYFIHSPSARDAATPVRDLMKGVLKQQETHPFKKPTVANLTPADISAGVEVVSSGHADLLSLGESARTVHEVVRIRTLFGNFNETPEPPIFPKVDISYIWGTESSWKAILGVRSLQQDIASSPTYNSTRSIRFIPLEGANHFVSNKPVTIYIMLTIYSMKIFYDDPLKAFAAFAQALE